MREQQLDQLLPHPPKELFKDNVGHVSNFDTRRKQGRRLEKIIDEQRDEKGNVIYDEQGYPKLKIDYPESGGIFVWHKSFPYPEKGFRRDHIVQAVQFTKAVLMGWIKFLTYKWLLPGYAVILFLPWGIKIKIIEKFLREYDDSVRLVIRPFYLDYIRYRAFCRELIVGVRTFMEELGIASDVSEQFAYTLATFIEFDMAYYLRLIDILSETTDERMLINSRKEIRFLINVLAKREYLRPHLIAKFDSFARLLTFTLWIPRVKRAFIKAIQSMKFESLQYDEADRYHVRHMTDYNFFGMTN